MPMKALCAEFLDILDEAASIARNLQPDQAELTVQMPIYNRPVRIVEALSIIIFHAGLVHSAQVAEPAGLPPLWMQLSPEIRHRVIGRAMRAFSLLYRHRYWRLAARRRSSFASMVPVGANGTWTWPLKLPRQAKASLSNIPGW